ncbi:hypothetical protein GJ496_000141 [Pomphorhynchus laevis]|nr:hypothetical protein GJ496_000141 [Pomphorhynchus laevis]
MPSKTPKRVKPLTTRRQRYTRFTHHKRRLKPVNDARIEFKVNNKESGLSFPQELITIKDLNTTTSISTNNGNPKSNDLLTQSSANGIDISSDSDISHSPDTIDDTRLGGSINTGCCVTKRPKIAKKHQSQSYIENISPKKCTSIEALPIDSFSSDSGINAVNGMFSPAMFIPSAIKAFEYALTGSADMLLWCFKRGIPSSLQFEKKLLDLCSPLVLSSKLKSLTDSSNLLHAAVLSKSLNTVKCCVTMCVDICHRDVNRTNCIKLAIFKSTSEIVKFLFESCDNTKSYLDEQAQTYCHYAALRGNGKIMDIVCSKCKCVDARDEDGWTPLDFALQHKDASAAFVLINKFNVNLMFADREGNNAIHWLSYYGNLNAFRSIIARRDIKYNLNEVLNSVNANGDTPLHIAVRNHRVKIVRELLRCNVDVNKKNKCGLYPTQGKELFTTAKIQKILDSYVAFKTSSLAVDRQESKQSLTFMQYLWPAFVLCFDLSNGRERFPIACVSTVNGIKAPTDFRYITINVFSSTSPDFPHHQSDPCFCDGDCTTLNCNCCRTSMRPPYNNEDLIADYFLENKYSPFIFECNQLCYCNPLTCVNRVVQRGSEIPLRIFWTESKGWGVLAEVVILKGAFVVEYVGEYVDDCKRDEDSYAFHTGQGEGMLDAYKFGNVARFINHSCVPNLRAVKVFTNHLDFRFPQICFYAKHDISIGEELSFDYGAMFWKVKNKTIACKCEASSCKYKNIV